MILKCIGYAKTLQACGKGQQTSPQSLYQVDVLRTKWYTVDDVMIA